MRAICEFVEYIKVITNHQDIRPPVIVKFYWLLSYERLDEFTKSNLYWKAFIELSLVIYSNYIAISIYRDTSISIYF